MHARPRFGIRIASLGTLVGMFIAAMAFLGSGSATAGPIIAAPVAAPVAAVADTAVGAAGCINAYDPHHNVKVFWTPGRVCPTAHYGISDAFSGTPGPKGDKGDPGDSRIVMTSGSATTAAGTAGNGTLIVTVSGLPGFSATQVHRTFVDVNAELLAGGVTASVGTPTASPGATSWNYPVTVAGQVAATPAQTVRIDVLAVPVS